MYSYERFLVPATVAAIALALAFGSAQAVALLSDPEQPSVVVEQHETVGKLAPVPSKNTGTPESQAVEETPEQIAPQGPVSLPHNWVESSLSHDRADTGQELTCKGKTSGSASIGRTAALEVSAGEELSISFWCGEYDLTGADPELELLTHACG